MMRTNRSMPACAVIPVLGYPDVGEASDWLCRTFGFAERWRAGSHRAQVAVGGGCAIALVHGEPGPDSVMIRVDDVATHHERAVAAGATVLGAPTDYPYGERQYTAVDHAGRHWTFSQTIADAAPEDWGGTSRAL
jgi:uncharacterized glyoxalase superfamily protein PhnB